MRRDLILRGGRVLCSGSAMPEPLEVRIGGNGRIVAIAPVLPDGDAQICSLGGQLVLPGLVDIHQHLDKSRTRALVSNPSGTLAGASAAYRALAPTITQDQIIALLTVEACSAYGTVAIRSHTNIDPQSGVRGIEAMVALRQRCVDRMRIQVVAHVTSDATSRLPESEAWLRATIELGIDAIGGVPAFSDQPIAFMKLLFEMAQRSGLPLDMHIDEHLDDAKFLFDELAQMMRAYGLAGRVVAGHCSALSAMPPDAALRTIDNLRDAGVAIVTLPAANLFAESPPPR
jgi:cytosine deaminase